MGNAVTTLVAQGGAPVSLVGDRWLTQGSAGVYTHHNPATGEPQAEIALGGAAEIDAAVAVARRAFDEWRRWKPDRRREVLLNLAALIRRDVEEIAALLVDEGGMLVRSARGLSTSLLAEYVSYYAGWAEKIEGTTVPVYPQDALDYTVPEPYGVVGAIIPWNGPLTPIGMKVAPALAAGNCVVIKPPELTPFTPALFARLCLEAGIPPGVVNVVAGSVEAGEALVRHPGIDKISFTGGSATARRILEGAAQNLVPVVLELGGKSPNLVFTDCDLAKAIPFAATMAMMRTGQSCLIPTRLLVERPVYEEVVDGVVAAIEAMKVGDPGDPATDIGPLISEQHRNRVESIVAEARAAGAGRLLTGGERGDGDLAKGWYLRPTVFADVDMGSHLAQNEVFGPVLCIAPFDDADEAIRLANATRYGLDAYVWTNDLTRGHRLAAELHAGTVCLNGFGMPVNAPFGGVGISGFGREGGRFGLEEFLHPKNVFVQL